MIGNVKVTAENIAEERKEEGSGAAPAVAQKVLEPADSPLLKLSDSVQSQIKEKLEGMSGIERELEEKALLAEVTAGQEVNKNLRNIFSKEVQEKEKRREEGRETLMDRFSAIFAGK